MQRDRSQNRPIRYRIVKPLGFTRRPFDEPLSPGLRSHRPVDAIGFTTTMDIVIDGARDAYWKATRHKQD